MAFSSFNEYGDNFGNRDIVRHISYFLNQRDKITMSISAKGVLTSLRGLLPTSTEYITTVKPNMMSVFSFSVNTETYSSPISTFQISKYGNFGNFYQSMITHVGANEEKDFYPAWYEHKLGLRNHSARNTRGSIDLYIRDLPEKDEKRLVERLRDSVDTKLCDHHCLQYTHGIMEAIEKNTSIVDVLAFSQISSSRCNLFYALSMRSTKLTNLDIVGGICDDTMYLVGDDCVSDLKKFSFTNGCSDGEIEGYHVDYICGNIAMFGILESLEIGNTIDHDQEWGYGLVSVLKKCPLESLTIDETVLSEMCLSGMVQELPLIRAIDISITNCEYFDWMKPMFDALFSNQNVSRLDLSYTAMGDENIKPLVAMIKRGVLTKLIVSACGVGKKGIRSILKATTFHRSKLECLSISDNDIQYPEIFKGLGKTSLLHLHVGYIEDDACLEELTHLQSNIEIDFRGSDECFDDGGLMSIWSDGEN